MLRSPLLRLASALMVLSPCQASPQSGVGHTSAAAAVATVDTIGVVLAAGDVAQCTGGATETAILLDSLRGGEILIPGDAAYASLMDPNPYQTCFDSTWGRHKARVHPVMGNHDLETRGKYFAYFGGAAAPPGGYYSFGVGPWHVIALNSNIDMRPRSPQGRWLAEDLELHQATRCTLVYMHHPRFSSGPHSKLRYVDDLWRVLEQKGVDVVISGHDHIYERFAPMTADGKRDEERGIRQFVAGTGGAGHYGIARLTENSEAHATTTYGILMLTLRPAGYDWQFLPAAGDEFHDAGSGTCH